MTVSIEHEVTVKASPSELYRALTTEAGLAAVWTRDLSVSEQVGGVSKFDFGPGDITVMRIEELTPNQSIRWTCTDSHEEWIGTAISFDLEERAGATVITLKHADWRELTGYYRFCNYHWAMFLLRLKRYCEEGVELPQAAE